MPIESVRMSIVLQRFITKTCPCNKQRFFKVVKNENGKCFYIFLIFAQNIDCGYTLEPPRRGNCNKYPKSMYWRENKKFKVDISLHTPVLLLYKSGVQGGIHFTDMLS